MTGELSQLKMPKRRVSCRSRRAVTAQRFSVLTNKARPEFRWSHGRRPIMDLNSRTCAEYPFSVADQMLDALHDECHRRQHF